MSGMKGDAVALVERYRELLASNDFRAVSKCHLLIRPICG